jgi:DNA-directed RNA polymerase subunit RPC12/RpoP
VLLESIACGNCGAPVRVPSGATYLTCRYCGSSLAVRHSESAAYTEVLERIDIRTDRMSADLAALRVQGEIERIDREWKELEAAFDRDTRALAASVQNAVEARTSLFPPMLGIAASIALLFVLPIYGFAEYTPLAPLLMVGFALIWLGQGLGKARRATRLERAYDRMREACITAEQNYRDRRRELVRSIEG